MKQEVIASVIDAQKEDIDKTPEGLSREIPDDVPDVKDSSNESIHGGCVQK